MKKKEEKPVVPLAVCPTCKEKLYTRKAMKHHIHPVSLPMPRG